MNKLVSPYVSFALILQLGVARVCLAQAPGTNMDTPQPNATSTSSSAPGEGDISPQLPMASAAQEPVIDTSTTRSTLPNRPLLITGALILGASYGASAVVAATSDRSADEKLYYPVVGPWMDLDDRNCDVNHCNNKRLNQGLLIGDGIVQGIGALSLLMGLFIPEKTTRHWYLIGQNSVLVLPQFDSSSVKLRAIASF
ncbi:MAG TPA: hypothetical protein VIV60_00870 [Polyangiaceae bacterium]